MKGPTLVLLTNHYPFGQGESFLEHEMPYLTATFEQVIIISKNTTTTQTHQLPLNVIVERIDNKTSFIQNLNAGLYCLKNRVSFNRLLKKEFRDARQRNKQSVFRTAFHFLFKAFQLSNTLKRILNKHQVTKNICFYSYWANNSALAISLLSYPASIKICRAHGGDLYEYRQKNNYLPFRKTLEENLTRIFVISAHGENYLKELFKNSAKIERSYLGTIQPVIIPVKKSDRFTIVSCSGLIELKRVHLIIESLSLLTEQVSWIHFGDGPLKKQLEMLAQDKLTPKINLEFTFKGFISNSDLIEFYTHHYVDVFINTSKYEGIPVSMMEAQSFGIPIVGTDVGAVREIVTPQTGVLVPETAKPVVIAEQIRFILQSPDARALRQSSKTHWQTNFKAANNFSTFATQLKSLLNETSG